MAIRNVLSQVRSVLFGTDHLRSRRREPRLACDLTVLYQLGEQEHEGRLLDVSPSGLRLKLTGPVKRGQEVHLTALPGSGVRCQVAWRRGDTAGLKYADADEKVATWWTQFALRRLERRERRVSAGVPVELHDLGGQLRGRGFLLDLSLGGAYVALPAPPAVGETLRLRLPEAHDASLYLLAKVVAERENGCGLQFFPADKSDASRLRRLLTTLVAGWRAGNIPSSPPDRAEHPPQAEPAEPNLQPLLLPPILIPGMLTLRGSVASALSSPLPLFESAELAVRPPAKAVAPSLELTLADARRGWLSWCPQGQPEAHASWDPSWLSRTLAGDSPAERVHAALALFALGGATGMRRLTLAAETCVNLCRALGLRDEVTLQLVYWAALLADLGELEWLLAGQPPDFRRSLAVFLLGLSPTPQGPADLSELYVPSYLFLRRRELGLGLSTDHPVRGAVLVGELAGLHRVAPAVRSHHERHDGQGFPDGLRGDEIPLVARALAIADTYATLRSQGFADEPARAALATGRGSYFDPSVLDAFLA